MYRDVTNHWYGSVYPTLKTLNRYKRQLEKVFKEIETSCQAWADQLKNNTYLFE